MQTMSEGFERVWGLHELMAATAEGTAEHTDAVLQAMRSDPEAAERWQTLHEQFWRTRGRPVAEMIIDRLMGMARYLSDAIGGPVPVLAPRDMVEASAGITRGGDEQVLVLGKAIQRSIATQVARNVGACTQELLTELRSVVAQTPRTVVPTGSKWLTTEEVAARLGLHVSTVERLCRQGSILADKTAGGQWRTTDERLRRSSYLDGQSRKQRSARGGQLE